MVLTFAWFALKLNWYNVQLVLACFSWAGFIAIPALFSLFVWRYQHVVAVIAIISIVVASCWYTASVQLFIAQGALCSCLNCRLTSLKRQASP